MEIYSRELGFRSRARSLLHKHFLLLASYRFGQAASRATNPFNRSLLLLIHHPFKLLMSVWCSSDIYSRAVIGRRFIIHTSRGVLIADDVIIGNDCTINNGVCIVNKANHRGDGVPRIGDNVRIGVGAKIMGGITIGNNVVIGANAVVFKDIPSNHMAVGVPAKLKSRVMGVNPLSSTEEKSANIPLNPPGKEAGPFQG